MNTRFSELLSKHLHGSLTEGEKRLLAAMIKEPENQLFLASKIDAQFLDSALKEVGDEVVKTEIFRRIQQELKDLELQQAGTQRPAPVVQLVWYKKKMARLVGFAASIILVIALGTIWFTKNKADQPSIVLKQYDKPRDSMQVFVRRELNITGHEKRIQLTDGSSIVLADRSEITYGEPFAIKREIILTGKAYFKVVKDPTRPFTVISGDISTTALGTGFTVTTLENSKQVAVRLYEGKVVVKAINKADKKMKKDVYLIPGQAFVYGSQTTSNVKTFKMKSDAAPGQIINEELYHDNPSIPENTEGSYFMFNNQSLVQVLDQLASMYQVEIVYNKEEVQNVYFTRKYNSSDSVETIIKEIAALNNLTVSRRDNTFTLSK